MFTGIIVGFVVLSIAYVLVSIYERSLKRQSLEADFDTEMTNGAAVESREAFVASGLADYEGSLRRRLLVLIYIIPMIAVVVTAYVVNFI
jgi:hypothetical protein